MKQTTNNLLSVMLLLIILSSCITKSEKQNREVATQTTESVQDSVEILTPELYGLYLEVDSGVSCKEIRLPVSLEEYIDTHNGYPEYQPTERLVEYLKEHDLAGGEYRCHAIPFGNKHICVMLIWLARAENEYYFVVTADKKGFIASSLIAQSVEDGILSFTLNEDLTILTRQRKWVYDEKEDTNLLKETGVEKRQVMINGEILSI